MAVFALLAGTMFLLTVFAPGEPAQMRNLFYWVVWILIAVAPAISMRLLSEEMRSGTIEVLMTSPVSDIEVILGKWLGGLAFFAVVRVSTLGFVGVLAVLLAFASRLSSGATAR